ncbi:hypothetical protein [Pseudomonas agarici]|uniref:hypothetical protein n=2 Tax=Pseudomonas agarici TaxID=46677 RepID=UPI0008C619BA|nr:hypothetical protein [Pseudomonas agarici]NWB93274.1 hypothetical protein [Pseudomonas agarici]NWC10573.1 hypothetical protein [Pseudomonas agarici]SEL10332.1 hypothetical protein SAMN05216604_11137 [Pseudomonas agarici]
MKRSVLPGWLVIASLLAAPAFADSEKDLCASNLQNINTSKASVLAADLRGQIDSDIQQAQAAQTKDTAAGSKECIVITQRAIQKIQNSQKGAR